VNGNFTPHETLERSKSATGIAAGLTSIDRIACISVILQQKITSQNSLDQFHPQGHFMKEVAVLLPIALMLNGCGSSTSTAVQATKAPGVWSADLSGGIGPASGFSFTTQFTLNGNGSLSITYFQFLTQGTCFPISGGSETGSMILNTVTTNNTVTGTFTYTVQSGGNTLALTGTVTGTANGTALSGGSITGTWSVTGGSGCSASGQSFTMEQTS
jgi:hypothetical protein